MNNKQKDVISSIVFLLFGIGLYIASLSVTSIIKNDVGPAFMPKIVAAAIMILAVTKLIFALKNNREGYVTKKEDDEDKKGGMLTIVALLLYVILFDVLGFILSTVLYLFAQFMILSNNGNRKGVLFGILAIIVPLIIYFMFVYGFDLILPSGVLGFI